MHALLLWTNNYNFDLLKWDWFVVCCLLVIGVNTFVCPLIKKQVVVWDAWCRQAVSSKQRSSQTVQASADFLCACVCVRAGLWVVLSLSWYLCATVHLFMLFTALFCSVYMNMQLCVGKWCCIFLKIDMWGSYCCPVERHPNAYKYKIQKCTLYKNKMTLAHIPGCWTRRWWEGFPTLFME